MTEPPVKTLEEATPLLRRPFTPAAIKWKVQSTWPKDGPKSGGMVVPYIDARLVIERLDTVIPGLWSDYTEPVNGHGNAMICRLTIVDQSRSDVGESTHSLKGAASDALKRAAVRFGIGASIYAMNRVMLDATPNGSMKDGRPTLKQVKRKNKDTAELTPEGEEWLREKYGAWIKTKDFGDPLDHGDTSETLGLEGADARPPEESNPELDAKVQEVEQLYAGLKPGQRNGLSKAKFVQQIRAASTSDEALEKLRTEIEERSK